MYTQSSSADHEHHKIHHCRQTPIQPLQGNDGSQNYYKMLLIRYMEIWAHYLYSIGLINCT